MYAHSSQLAKLNIEILRAVGPDKCLSMVKMLGQYGFRDILPNRKFTD